MSTRSDLEALVRIAPEVDTTAVSDTALRLFLDKGQIDLALKGRALPRNEKVNVVASQRELLSRSGYAVPDEVSLPFAHQVLRDLADRASLLCTKHAPAALCIMRLVRRCTPGLLPKVR